MYSTYANITRMAKLSIIALTNNVLFKHEMGKSFS